MGNGPNNREKVALASGDVVADQVAKLRHLFPEAFTEGKIDFEKLRATLGESVESGPNRFSFTWAGKEEAIALLQTPSRATLVPAKDESVNFAATRNVFIEGDNLEVLKLLYKPYFGRVKLIYIDPPYNTGQDFIYPDNYADPLSTYLKLTGQIDSEGNLQTSNPETSGRYHSAWLSMMYPRLFLARQLLSDDGVIFVSIDEHEMHHLKMLMNEIFGEENSVGIVVWKGATDNNPTQIATEHEYVICYSRNKGDLLPDWKNRAHDAKVVMMEEYARLRELHATDNDLVQADFRKFIRMHKESLSPLTHYDKIDDHGPYTGSRKVHNPKPGGYKYNIIHKDTNEVCIPPVNGYRYPEETMRGLLAEKKILFGDDATQIVQIKEYIKDFEGKLSSVIHLDSRVGSNELNDLFGEDRKVFTNPKPTALLKELFGFCLGDTDLMIDFFGGSCSSAQAILEMNREDSRDRKFIVVQLPEPTDKEKFPSIAERFPTIAEIGKERIRRVIARLKLAKTGQFDFDAREMQEGLGFKVFKLSRPNIQHWTETKDRDPDAYTAKLGFYNDSLVPGWSPQNLLWELALREGYSLNATFEAKKLANGNTIHEVTDPDEGRRFVVCLDEKILVDLTRSHELTADSLFICRDIALDDTTAANLALQCRLKTI